MNFNGKDDEDLFSIKIILYIKEDVLWFRGLLRHWCQANFHFLFSVHSSV